MSTDNILTFTGELAEGVYIATGTNPWVEVDGKPVDWTQRDLAVAPDNDCDTCCDQTIPGAIAAMDTDIGIQACDNCKRFPGDLEAAQALADLVGGTVKFEREEGQIDE